MKTNIGLVEHAEKALQERWGYVWGTFGQVLTQTLFSQKLKQYPSEVGKYESFIKDNWLNKKTADCIGLIKSYMWTDNSGRVLYDSKTDVSANNMYSRAEIKGPIQTIPETKGLLVWKKGHIGIYVGNEWVIEANSTKKGVIKTPLKGNGSTPWTDWCKNPFIKYEGDSKPAEIPVKKPAFNPVPKSVVSDWAKDAQKFVKENNISDGTNPKLTATREELWVMMHNFYKMMGGVK